MGQFGERNLSKQNEVFLQIIWRSWRLCNINTCNSLSWLNMSHSPFTVTRLFSTAHHLSYLTRFRCLCIVTYNSVISPGSIFHCWSQLSQEQRQQEVARQLARAASLSPDCQTQRCLLKRPQTLRHIQTWNAAYFHYLHVERSAVLEFQQSRRWNPGRSFLLFTW